jgi:hypothetical protein
MSKTLDSVRDKKFVAETLKRALAAQSPLAFFCVLKHQEDKKPALLLGNPDAELKKVALQPAAQIIKGRCRKGADGVEFYTDDADDETKFKEAIRKVAKDAGLTPFDAILKPASALGEEGGTAQNQTLDQLAERAKAGGPIFGKHPEPDFLKRLVGEVFGDLEQTVPRVEGDRRRV